MRLVWNLLGILQVVSWIGAEKPSLHLSCRLWSCYPGQSALAGSSGYPGQHWLGLQVTLVSQPWLGLPGTEKPFSALPFSAALGRQEAWPGLEASEHDKAAATKAG